MWHIGEIEEVWFGGYELVPSGPFAWAQHMCATKWARDTSSTSSSWKRSCTRNFHLETAFILWLIEAQSFYPNPFFPLKWLALISQLQLLALIQVSLPMVWNNWKGGANEGLVKHFSNHVKSMSNSSLNKSNPSQNTKLVSWGIKVFSTTKNLVVSNTPNSIWNSLFSSQINQLRFTHIAETLM